MLIYFFCQGIYTKIILKALDEKISLIKGTFFAMVEFFFSGITPSSTGGQPLQLYYMTKNKIQIRKSYITLILNTIYFKIILLVLGIIILIFEPSFIINSKFIYKVCFAIGFIIDMTMVILGMTLLFKTSIIKKIYVKLSKILSKNKKLKRKIDKINIDNVLKKYEYEIDFIKTHKKVVIETLLITFIQRIFLFSIIYIVYRSLGFNKYNYFDLLALQITVQVAIESVPFPGGVGVSEKMMHSLFSTIFASSFADIGMLLTRTFTFYIPLLLSGIIVLINYIYMRYIKLNKKLVS